MKTKSLSLLAMGFVAFAFAFSVLTTAAPAPKPASAVARAANAAIPIPPEPHPEIREALASLRKAKFRLEHANHDFGGHRAEAVKATDEAIRQLQLCLQFDR